MSLRPLCQSVPFGRNSTTSVLEHELTPAVGGCLCGGEKGAALEHELVGELSREHHDVGGAHDSNPGDHVILSWAG